MIAERSFEMVQFQFQFGHRRDGGLGVRTVPIYSITDWRAATGADGELVFRPSWRTAWRRLAITLAAAVFLLMLAWTSGLPWQPAAPAPAPQQDAEIDAAAADLQRQLERNMTPEARQQFSEQVARAGAERDRRLAAMRADQARWQRVGRAVHWTLFHALVALGLAPLLLAAWERIDLRNGPDGELIVRRRRFLTRERVWPRGCFGGILCSAAEHVHHPRRGWRHHLGWFWEVRLLPRHESGGMAVPRHVDDPIVEFHVAQEPERPTDERQPPRRVRTFLKHICRLAEIKPRDVQFGLVPDPGRAPRTFWGRRRPRSHTVTYASEPVVESATYGSLDELPADVQAQIRRLRRQGIPPEGVTHESTRITVRDADGNEQTYTSLDDLPPDIREQYEKARRTRRGS